MLINLQIKPISYTTTLIFATERKERLREPWLSSTGDTQEDWEWETTCWRESGGREWGRSQNIRGREPSPLLNALFLIPNVCNAVRAEGGRHDSGHQHRILPGYLLRHGGLPIFTLNCQPKYMEENLRTVPVHSQINQPWLKVLLIQLTSKYWCQRLGLNKGSAWKIVKSSNRKSVNSWAHSAITNPQVCQSADRKSGTILWLHRKSQTCRFLWCSSSIIVNSQNFHYEIGRIKYIFSTVRSLANPQIATFAFSPQIKINLVGPQVCGFALCGTYLQTAHLLTRGPHTICCSV